MYDMIEEGLLFFLIDEVISVDSGCFLHEFKNIWWKTLDKYSNTVFGRDKGSGRDTEAIQYPDKQIGRLSG